MSQGCWFHCSSGDFDGWLFLYVAESWVTLACWICSQGRRWSILRRLSNEACRVIVIPSTETNRILFQAARDLAAIISQKREATPRIANVIKSVMLSTTRLDTPGTDLGDCVVDRGNRNCGGRRLNPHTEGGAILCLRNYCGFSSEILNWMSDQNSIFWLWWWAFMGAV